MKKWKRNVEKILTISYKMLNHTCFKDELPALKVKLTRNKYYAGVTRTDPDTGEPVDIMLNMDNVNLGDIEKTTGILLHEMIHVYCHVKGLPSFNREDQTHPQEFIAAAADRLLFYDDCLATNFFMIADFQEEFLDPLRADNKKYDKQIQEILIETILEMARTKEGKV